jgi:predicted enzyme related to lactoylglutathione lyase
MTEPNVDIVIDCGDPDSLADFWAEALGYAKAFAHEQYWVLLPPVREHPPVILQRVPEAKTAKARIHFDLRVPDIEAEAQRLEALGARRIDIGQGESPGWITMADPEGNEFCVCPGVPLPAAGR